MQFLEAHATQDSLAERSKALAYGASPKGRGFEPHSCHVCYSGNAYAFSHFLPHLNLHRCRKTLNCGVSKLTGCGARARPDRRASASRRQLEPEPTALHSGVIAPQAGDSKGTKKAMHTAPK